MKKQEIIPKQIKEIHIGTGKVIKHTVMVNVRECGLDFMLHRGLIKEKQHRAGIIFRRYFDSIFEHYILVDTCWLSVDWPRKSTTSAFRG